MVLAVANALYCVGQEDLTLKSKQEEALIHLYDGRGVLAVCFSSKSNMNGRSWKHRDLP